MAEAGGAATRAGGPVSPPPAPPPGGVPPPGMGATSGPAGPAYPPGAAPTFAGPPTGYPAGVPSFPGAPPPPGGGRGKLVAAIAGGFAMVVVLAVIGLLVLGPGGGENGLGRGSEIEIEGDSGSFEIPKRVGQFEANAVDDSGDLVSAGALASALITYRSATGVAVVLHAGLFPDNDKAALAAVRVVNPRVEQQGYTAQPRQGGGVIFRKDNAEILGIVVEDEDGRGWLLYIESTPGVPEEFFNALDIAIPQKPS